MTSTLDEIIEALRERVLAVYKEHAPDKVRRKYAFYPVPSGAAAP